MKKSKWLLSVLLAFVLTIQLLPGFSNASSASVEESSISVQYLGVNESEIGTEIPLEFVKQFGEYDNPNEITERYYFMSFNEDGTTTTNEIDESQLNTLSVSPTAVNGVTVSTRIDPVPGKSQMTMKSTIRSITGKKPNKLDFKLQLGKAATRSNSTSVISSVTYTLQGVLGIKVGAEVKHTFNISGTGFYTGVLDLTAKNLLGGVVGTDRANTDTLLVNKIGDLYPVYTDPASKKVMKEPARADWARVPSVKWTTHDRNKYIQWYNKKYPNVYDWNKNHVHHMRPRNLGGTNDYSNLIPLPKTFHTGTVSPWFTRY
ncbi:HNH endonuclease [Paenibacillus faecalis]|uniref:HNH endonuclease n=1 Tax=Paenibacillus faecalis TaxID=2079532 RepID=UPI000D10D1EB|nr:HNH endonuclease [Paenibacillus faecalis]